MNLLQILFTLLMIAFCVVSPAIMIWNEIMEAKEYAANLRARNERDAIHK